MQHISDDDLVLHYYREQDASNHLAGCAECSARFEALRRDLDAVPSSAPPEPGSLFEQQTWNAIAPRLRKRPKILRISTPIAAAAVLALASFSIGRWTVQRQQVPVENAQAVRERVLIVAVGDHLERSQMVIAEVVNASPGEDLKTQRDLAELLVGPNRLYRQTAASAGDAATATLLEDIERALLEVAHAPDQLQGEAVDRLRERIKQQGLLFRIRVTESQLQERIGTL
jgi:hypothetical protein